MPKKKYFIDLSTEERESLRQLVGRGQALFAQSHTRSHPAGGFRWMHG